MARNRPSPEQRYLNDAKYRISIDRELRSRVSEAVDKHPYNYKDRLAAEIRTYAGRFGIDVSSSSSAEGPLDAVRHFSAAAYGAGQLPKTDDGLVTAVGANVVMAIAEVATAEYRTLMGAGTSSENLSSGGMDISNNAKGTAIGFSLTNPSVGVATAHCVIAQKNGSLTTNKKMANNKSQPSTETKPSPNAAQPPGGGAPNPPPPPPSNREPKEKLETTVIRKDDSSLDKHYRPGGAGEKEVIVA